MSFGFSVGDCILLIDIARTQYNNCVAAGPEYREIAREVKTLFDVLEFLHNESSKTPSPLLRGDQTFTTQLASAVNGCRHILEDLQTLLAKYEGISGNGKAVNLTRKLWHKIRFGSKIQALGEVRGKIILYTTTISVLLDAMQLRATGRLEDKLDVTNTTMVDGFQSIKLVMVEEMLKAKSLTQRQSTASLLSMLTCNEDDKEIWKEFRRELVAKGFKSNQLDRHKDTLMAYMLKLEQSGVLDEVGIAESAQSWRETLVYNNIETSPDLQPIEEEENLATPPTVHQQLAVETSLAQSSGSESLPRREYEETPSISLFIEPSSNSPPHTISTFLHTVISHALSEGPQALEQTLDLYPQLLEDPYLDATISAQPIPGVRESLRTIVATTRQLKREKEVIVPQYVALEEERPDRERAAERTEEHETERTEGLEIITKQVGAELSELRIAEGHRFREPFLTCYRCAKPHIEYELHYNCEKCSYGNWNICLNCYRTGKGCQHWFGFCYAAWSKWLRLKSSGRLSPEAEKPHILTANRYIVLATSLGGADGRRTLTTQDPRHRLQSGAFCSNCLAWANECYWQCNLCNDGDWGFCNTCVNQGKCCTHPLLPLACKANKSATLSTSLLSVQDTPSSATILTTPGVDSFGHFKPLTFRPMCDICCYPIQPNAARYHCFSCTSAHPHLQLPFKPGDYDICTTCYSKIEASKRISTENGHGGWRRCLQGHRMIIVGFEDSHGGQRRIILNDLVGGRLLKEEPSQSFGEPGVEFRRWSWSNGTKMRFVATDVMFTAQASSARTIDFPPDGGLGMTALALWSWYPEEGALDELLFPPGAELKEIVDINGEWSYGVYMGAQGLFPSPYVKMLTIDGGRKGSCG